MKISVLTLFPEMFEGPFSHSIIKNAVEKKLIKLEFINIRNFGIGKHKVVDDRPYGGGRGMVLRVDVLVNALEFVRSEFKKNNKQKIVLLDPAGERYHHKKAKEFASLDHLVLICGHYEGFDERIRNYIDEEISLGDFILTGGEIPAMAIVDSVSRLKEGVLPENAAENESFSENDNNQSLLEHPQYTRPEKFRDLHVPKILLSGNHREVLRWRKKQAIKNTRDKRPDLIKTKKA